MKPLFIQQVPRRGRVLVMLAGSLVFHGGLVGIGALFVQPPPPYVVVDYPLVDQEEAPPVRATEFPQAEPVESMPTATPEPIESPVDTPPAVIDDVAFAEPASPTPRQKISVKTKTAVRSGTSHVASSASLLMPGGSQSGTDVGSAAGTAAWVMPHPPYPSFARVAPVVGVTVVKVTTDAAGRVSNVTIVRSTGNPLLDAHTVSYVRSNWRGPADASRTTEFVYQIK